MTTVQRTPQPAPSAAPGPVPPLPDALSARALLSRGQAVTAVVVPTALILALLVRVTTGYGPSLVWWGQAFVATVTAIYVAVIGFKLVVVFGGGAASVVPVSAEELAAIPDQQLPTYTILVPLHREARVLPYLIRRLTVLDYPADRLQILLLIEADDDQTRDALALIDLDHRFEVVTIPPGGPRTKPNACNVGLARAVGEFCVIYDAEDRPETDQLRKAVRAFRRLSGRVVCVQAELQYWNPWTNWLTSCFAAEYDELADVVLRRGVRHQLQPLPAWDGPAPARHTARRNLQSFPHLRPATAGRLGSVQRHRGRRPGRAYRPSGMERADDGLGDRGGGEQPTGELDPSTQPMDQGVPADVARAHA